MSRRMPTELLQMLTYRRPAGSTSERAFRERFLAPLGVQPDKAGNLILRIGDAPVLWSCHTDTVHSKPGRQNVRLSAKGQLTLARLQFDSDCLGADDGAGCWLMREMILSKVEGLYVFHFGEERGGIGSTHIASETPELLKGIRYAIALDRAGERSVITRQFGGRCASDTFAEALGKAIGLGMEPDGTGTFTDTANYTELIPECTNLSVGYDGAHSDKESLDVPFVVALRDRLCKLDTRSLPVLRDPSVKEYSRSTYSGLGSLDLDDWISNYQPNGKRVRVTYTEKGRRQVTVSALSERDKLAELARHRPQLVADYLDQFGITAEEIEESDGSK